MQSDKGLSCSDEASADPKLSIKDHCSEAQADHIFTGQRQVFCNTAYITFPRLCKVIRNIWRTSRKKKTPCSVQQTYSISDSFSIPWINILQEVKHFFLMYGVSHHLIFRGVWHLFFFFRSVFIECGVDPISLCICSTWTGPSLFAKVQQSLPKSIILCYVDCRLYLSNLRWRSPVWNAS